MMQPPDFNGTAPPDWNGNMTMPSGGPSDFGSGNRPDFNGTMPMPSGSPSEMDGQPTPQAVEGQTDYTLIAVGGIVLVVLVGVVGVVLLRKRKNRQVPQADLSQEASI
jgi:LPXTG-motif cell wall-anchored protein